MQRMPPVIKIIKNESINRRYDLVFAKFDAAYDNATSPKKIFPASVVIYF